MAMRKLTRTHGDKIASLFNCLNVSNYMIDSYLEKLNKGEIDIAEYRRQKEANAYMGNQALKQLQEMGINPIGYTFKGEF